MATLRTAHQKALLRVIGFQRRLRIDHTILSYPKALKMTRWDFIETTIRKRLFFFAVGVARQSMVRLPSRVMFGTIAGGENPTPGGQFKTWHRCIVETFRRLPATEGSKEHAPLVFGVETALWSTAAIKAGMWYGGPSK